MYTIINFAKKCIICVDHKYAKVYFLLKFGKFIDVINALLSSVGYPSSIQFGSLWLLHIPQGIGCIQIPTTCPPISRTQSASVTTTRLGSSDGTLLLLSLATLA
jgi:hypothetical protein